MCLHTKHGQKLRPKKVGQDLAALLQGGALFLPHMGSPLSQRHAFLPFICKAPFLCGKKKNIFEFITKMSFKAGELDENHKGVNLGREQKTLGFSET